MQTVKGKYFLLNWKKKEKGRREGEKEGERRTARKTIADCICRRWPVF